MCRLSYLVAFAVSLLAGACGTAGPPAAVSIAETEFAPELQIDLAEFSETESGLYYREAREGTGATAEPGDEVSIRYTGWLPDGTPFDSNVAADEPLTFRLGDDEVIPGFDEGVVGMQVDGQRQLIVPPDLGYGAQGTGNIPPNAVLFFAVELVHVDDR